MNIDHENGTKMSWTEALGSLDLATAMTCGRRRRWLRNSNRTIPVSSGVGPACSSGRPCFGSCPCVAFDRGLRSLTTSSNILALLSLSPRRRFA